MGNTSLRITLLMFASAMLLPTVNLSAQKMYSLGGGSILQSVDINDYSVVDIATLVPSMSDIAFHPDGTLYGVNENTIYKINTTDGSSVVIKNLPPAYGWLLGLTIDYSGVFFMSGFGGDKDFIVSYDPSNDIVINIGTTGWRHWDLEFYNGQLYLTGGTENTSKGYLIQVDISNPTKSDIILDFGAQAYGMTSFNNTCGGVALIAATSKRLIRLDPRDVSFTQDLIDDPKYTFSSGTASRSSYLGSLPPLRISSVDFTGPLCDANGVSEIEVSILQGRTGVEYSIDGIVYQSSSTFSGATPGIYQAYVKDDAGCTDMSDPFEIKFDRLLFTVQSRPAHCGEDNGTLAPVGTMPDDSLEYSFDGIDYYANAEFTNLAEGDYIIYAKNKLGCIDSLSVTVEVIPMLKHQSSSTPEHCGQNDGTIYISATGGQAPYSYEIFALPAQTEPEFTGLHASTFLVKVEDVLGCGSESLIDVDSAAGPVIEQVIIQSARCGMPDGSIEIISFPVSTDLEYSVNGGPTTTNPEFSNLEPGMYTILVTNAFGCNTMSSIVVPAIDGPVVQNIIVENDYCASAAGSISIEASASIGGLDYALDNGPFTPSPVFNGLTIGNYVVTVRDSFGCDAIQNILVEEEPLPKIDAIESVDPTCGESNGSIVLSHNSPFNVLFSLDNIEFQQSEEFFDLLPGDYNIYLVDENDCVDSAVVSLIEIEQTMILDILTANENCLGQEGDLVIRPDKDTTNVQYSIDGSTFQLDNTFSVPGGRNYTGYLLDQNGCIDSLQTFIGRNERIVLNKISTTNAQCSYSDGSATIEVEGDVIVRLNSDLVNPSGIIPDLAPGSYQISIMNDDGCSLDTLIQILATDCDTVPDKNYNVYIPNAFSPNGDGINEILSPFFDPSAIQLLQFQVFDRWGNNVFKCADQCAWDGMSSGEPAAAGVYVYVMQILGEEGNVSEMSGDVTLLR